MCWLAIGTFASKQLFACLCHIPSKRGLLSLLALLTANFPRRFDGPRACRASKCLGKGTRLLGHLGMLAKQELKTRRKFLPVFASDPFWISLM